MCKGRAKRLFLASCAALFLAFSAFAVSAAELPCESPDDPEYYKYLKKLENAQLGEDSEYSAENAVMGRYYLEAVAPKEEPLVGTLAAFEAKSPFDGKIHRHNARFSEDYELINGVDVSYYNGNIDWKQYYDAGVRFAIVRSSYRGYGTAGTLKADTQYKNYIPAAAKLGIPIGIYHYTQAITVDEAIAEANYVISLIAPYKQYITLPVVFDFEYAEGSGGFIGRLYNAKLTKQQKTDLCLAFCRTIENAGYKAMVYSSMSVFNNELNTKQISDKYQIWLAHYTTETPYAGEYSFWQYGYGTIGSYKQVDSDFWYKPIGRKISFDSSEVLTAQGRTQALKYTLTPAGSVTVTFTSSAPDIISVDDKGNITALKHGKAVITASLSNGSTAQCTVLCPLETKLDKSLMQLVIGKQERLVATTVSGGDCEGVFSSTDPSVASVEPDGTVTALSAGKCEIRFTSDGGLTYSACAVETGEDPVSISLPPKTSVPREGTAVLLMSYGNVEAEGKFTLNWTSSDENVATVTSTGIITGVSKGTCTVTVSCLDLTASCEVTVTNKLIKFSASLPWQNPGSFNDPTGNPDIGSKLTVTLTPATGEDSVSSSIFAGGTVLLTAPEGMYTLELKRPGFLSYTDKSFELGVDAIPSIELPGGDIDGDSVIDVFDLSMLCEKCERFAGGEYDPLGDLDSDGEVIETDVNILAGNYGRTPTVID